MKTKNIILSLCMALILSGCSISPKNEPDPAWAKTGIITVGNVLTVRRSDERWNLLSNIDTLTAEGLYYAAWAIGENRFEGDDDEDAVNLYDAQIYLLLGEFSDESAAEENMDKWLDAAKANYEITDEEELACNGQSYLLITYRCVNGDNPYDNGASAFGVWQAHATCIELTVAEDFDEDAKTLLVDFLNGCTYGPQTA